MLLPLLTIFDFATVRANFIKPLDLDAVKVRSSDFALLVPIFNDTKYLSNLDFLKKYSENVVLCTTTNESKEFYKSLKEIAKNYGFRINYSNVGTKSKNPWAIYNKTLLAHDAVLKDTISGLREKYVIFIDADTFVDGDLRVLCGAMEERNFDIASVKVLPTQRETIMEHLQGIEYDIAMQARLIYPWLTSGAGMVAKRSVMESIMINHSLFFNGGDVEIGKLADMMGYKVGHIPMVFYTDIPPTFKKWAKQRFSWMCGMFRHSIVNMDHNLKHPFHFIYFSFIIYFLLPFKLIQMVSHIHLLPFILALYVIVTYLANWKVRNKWMILFPFYALFQVLVLVWFGAFRYMNTVLKTGNIGKIRFKHNPNKVRISNPRYALNTIKNHSVIVSVISLILIFNVNFAQRLILGRDYEPVELVQVASAKVYSTSRDIIEGKELLTPVYVDRKNSPSVAGVSTQIENTNQGIKQTNKEYYVIEVEPGDENNRVSMKALTEYLKEEKISFNEKELGYANEVLSKDLPLIVDHGEVYYIKVYKQSIEEVVEVTMNNFGT